MKRFCFLFSILIVALSACQEDADKVISTDLPTEAGQLFDLSTAWSESLYFGLLSLEEYQSMDSTSTLPGCPTLTVESDSSKVSLEFTSENECLQSGDANRSGKIILQYVLSDSISSNWTMEYEDYSFEENSLTGVRFFKKDSSNQIAESFSSLKMKTKEELTTTFSGNLKHSKSNLLTSSIGIISGGTINGVNPVGRDFSMEIPNDRLMLSSCFLKNELIPVAGSETWNVGRSNNKIVTYQLDYELIDSCQVAANALLPDGRTLLLNP